MYSVSRAKMVSLTNAKKKILPIKIAHATLAFESFSHVKSIFISNKCGKHK